MRALSVIKYLDPCHHSFFLFKAFLLFKFIVAMLYTLFIIAVTIHIFLQLKIKEEKRHSARLQEVLNLNLHAATSGGGATGPVSAKPAAVPLRLG